MAKISTKPTTPDIITKSISKSALRTIIGFKKVQLNHLLIDSPNDLYHVIKYYLQITRLQQKLEAMESESEEYTINPSG